ncbi:MAG: hemolysin III family protein [Candidatus Pacebacteria bacterium]|nr:hemolysin III family protein [Candidatus Paceibacterota bacterium]
MLDLSCWVAGALIYLFGAVLYIARIPERFAPGRFDFFVCL